MKYRTNIVNVFGEEESDPRCEYRNCYHELSKHGLEDHNNECECHHFTNRALGVVREQ